MAILSDPYSAECDTKLTYRSWSSLFALNAIVLRRDESDGTLAADNDHSLPEAATMVEMAATHPEALGSFATYLVRDRGGFQHPSFSALRGHNPEHRDGLRETHTVTIDDHRCKDTLALTKERV